MTRRSLLFASAAGSVLASPLLLGQEHPSGQPADTRPTFSSELKLVNILANVRDKNGKLVTDLTKDDFVVEEDGRPQPIKYFARQSDTPLLIGLLVDTSGSERRMIGTERDASETFINNAIRPDRDKAFLIHFDREVELLQDLTSSQERLNKALGLLATNSGQRPDDPDNQGSPPDNGGGGGGGYGRGRGRGGGTLLYDAVYLASNEVLAPQTGRKAVLLLTDGEDRNSKTSLPSAIASAQRADVLVYAVRIADTEQHMGFGGPGMGRRGGGMGWPGGGGGGWPGGGGGGGGGRGGNRGGWEHVDGKKVLQQMSEETGGAYYEVGKKKSLNDIYQEMMAELRNQYSIAYVPDSSTSPGYHKLQVTVKDHKNFTVQARQGYYSKV